MTALQPNFTAAPDVRSAARGYAADGVRVVPLRAGSKVPALKDWPNAATADVAKVDQLFAPGSNVGIATGRGLLVIDLDGDDAPHSLAGLEEQLGALPTTRTVETASGGHHLYF